MISSHLHTIGSFCQTGSGATPSRASAERYYGGSIPWVKSGELRERDIVDTEEHVTELALQETRLKVLPANTILVAMYGATVGRVGVLRTPATTNQAVCHIIPDPCIADTRYMYYALRNLADHFVGRGVGGAQPNISQTIVQQARVFLPSLHHQRRLAAILDQADELRRKRQICVAKLSAVAQSLFADMFSDVLCGGRRISLGEIVTEFRYGTSNKSGETGYPTLRIPNIVGERYNLEDLKKVLVTEEEYRRLRLMDGDLLFVRTNGNPDYVGRSAVIDTSLGLKIGRSVDDFIFASYLIRARLRKNTMHPLFVQVYLSSGDGRKQIRTFAKTSAGQFNINTEGLGALRIPLADFSKQQMFADHLARLQPLSIAFEIHALKLDALFASLQHRAFAGELTAKQAERELELVS